MSVDLCMQRAQRMRLIILSSLALLAVPYSFTVSHNRCGFRKKKLLNLKCVLIFSTTIVSKMSYSKKQ